MLIGRLYDFSVYCEPYQTVFFPYEYLLDFLQGFGVCFRILRPYSITRLYRLYRLEAFLCMDPGSCREAPCLCLALKLLYGFFTGPDYFRFPLYFILFLGDLGMPCLQLYLLQRFAFLDIASCFPGVLAGFVGSVSGS